jgi:RNA polymerase sigma-70 factor (ECF subfamily)
MAPAGHGPADLVHPPELIDACRRGDKAALERVLRAHTPDLTRFLTRMIGPSADVDDLLQATLIATVSAFPRFRGEASVRTWMTRIAVNVVREHLRRPERTRKVSLELVADEPPSGAPGSDQIIDQRGRLERVYHHLNAIPAKQRVAFVLHVFEGRPMEEVAALTDASVTATKSRVFFARRALLARARKDARLRDLLTEEVPS